MLFVANGGYWLVIAMDDSSILVDCFEFFQDYKRRNIESFCVVNLIFMTRLLIFMMIGY